jgi:hypothetical protein
MRTGQTLVVEWYGGAAPALSAAVAASYVTPPPTITFYLSYTLRVCVRRSPRGGRGGAGLSSRGRGASTPTTTTRGRGRGAAGGRGRGGRTERPAVSAEDLDRQLDEYVKAAAK